MAKQNGPPQPPPPGGSSTNQANTMAMLCHLSALAGFIIPFGNIVGPLIVWLVKKDEFPEVDQHGKESLNFQISVSIYTIVAAFLIFIVIGIFLVPLLLIANLVLIILAGVKANKGEFFAYPACIRLIK